MPQWIEYAVYGTILFLFLLTQEWFKWPLLAGIVLLVFGVFAGLVWLFVRAVLWIVPWQLGSHEMNTPITFEGMMLVGFIFWVLYLFNQHTENRREEIRRYSEKYPLGKPSDET